MRQIVKIPLSDKTQDQLNNKESNNWKKLTKNQRKEIINKLLLSQKELCCYCENRIEKETSHIEHFKERSVYPELIFVYSNHFLSCNGITIEVNNIEASCGHQKSNKNLSVDYDLLLCPSENNEALFSYLDGIIKPSDKCSESEQEKVNYTIECLKLDSSNLKNQRIEQILLITEMIDGLDLEKQKELIEDLLDETQNKLAPFFSTIKDNFEFILNE